MTKHRENEQDSDEDIGGSIPQEAVEDRPDVSVVKPEDYPEPASGKQA